MERALLQAHSPLVAAVTEWLTTQVRVTSGGVSSLSHLMVIVPTRQSGRRLRLALAQRFTNGCLPPLIRLPLQTVVPAREPALPAATAAESLGVLCRILMTSDLACYAHLFPEKGRPRNPSFTWALGVARQLHDLWGLLEENALDMRDVAAQVGTLLSGEDLDVEIDRWQDLAQLEARFFDALTRLGRTPRPTVRKQAVAEPGLPDGVERIVLPALTDAMPALYTALSKLGERVTLTILLHADSGHAHRFDAWGRPDPASWLGPEAPVLPLHDEQITLAADSAEQARLAARIFAGVSSEEALPALGMADEALFTELYPAFLNVGFTLHNPANYPLASSSLGRLIQQLERLGRDPRWPVLAAFMREADVIRWLEQRLDSGPFNHALILGALDKLQNEHLPQTFEDARRFCDLERAQARAHAETDTPSPWEHLSRALAAIGSLLDPKGRPHLSHLSSTLQTLFAGRILHEQTPGDRELAAAATAALTVFEDMTSPLLKDALDDNQRATLFDTLIASAHYQLEPEDSDVLLTEGWLELPWSPARELVITGFNEGSIPDAVVGHSFLPDRLRTGLGLMSNERRTARDTYLLHALLTSRPPDAVHLLLERVSETNDARKPSRLLFLCDDATLAARSKKLFSPSQKTATGHHRTLPDTWRLRLPLPDAPPQRVSVTGLSDYLKCPFTFYLKHVLRMEACDDRATELNPAAFGNLCHTVLERFGKSEHKDSSDPKAILAFLDTELWTLVHSLYGRSPPAVIHMQAAAAAKRLAFFATRQAQIRSEGWQITETEQTLEMRERGMKLSGRADRIDHHPSTGAWRIIDYKTWDTLGNKDGTSHFVSSSKSDIEAAATRGLEPFDFDGKPHVWTDLQLPLYLLMLQANGRAPSGVSLTCGVFTLGETQAETVCKTWDFSPYQNAAVTCVRCVIDRVKAGIYWPPSKTQAWTRDFASLFMDSPEAGIDAAWISDQEARLAKGGASCAS